MNIGCNYGMNASMYLEGESRIENDKIMLMFKHQYKDEYRIKV